MLMQATVQDAEYQEWKKMVRTCFRDFFFLFVCRGVEKNREAAPCCQITLVARGWERVFDKALLLSQAINRQLNGK